MSGDGKCSCMLGPLGRVGPLGAKNMRQQLGRSFKLRVGNSPTVIGEAPLNRDERLVDTGAGVEDEESGRSAGDAYASALSITCHLDMIDELPEPQPQPGNIIGVIEWGTDGTSAKAEFDWKHGTVIQVSGAMAILSARLEDIPGQQQDVEQTVGAHIGYYPVTKCLPTRTFATAAIPNGQQSVVIRIPRFACRVFFLAVPFNAPDVVLQYSSDQAPTIIAEGAATTPGGLVIPGRAHYVRIDNRGAIALTESRLVFELAL